jgi:hypothetical protein
LLCGALCLLLSVALPSSAAVILVPDHHSSISTALAAATPGDEVHVSDAGSPYEEQIFLVDGVVLRGGYDATFTSFDPSSHETVIQLPDSTTGSVVEAGTAGAATRLEGFTITGGDTVLGGGIFCGTGTALEISLCIVRDNYASQNGGGIQISGSAARVTQCTIQDNIAGLRGGGISVAIDSEDAVVSDCSILSNSADPSAASTISGGGGFFSRSAILFERNLVDGNFSGRHGGGIMLMDTGLAGWWNEITANQATENGGGIYLDGGTSVHQHCILDGNTAGINGGGLASTDGSNRFLNGSILNNTATGDGGGIHLAYSMADEVRGTDIAGNSAANGGGLLLEGPSTGSFAFYSVEDNSFSANTTVGTGGGIHVTGQSIGTIRNNIIAGTLAGAGFSCGGASANPVFHYNDVYNDPANPDDGYGGTCEDRTGIAGNIRADPEYCDASALPADLALAASSPCLGAGLDGSDMGAHDAADACGTTSLAPASWGRVKALYR